MAFVGFFSPVRAVWEAVIWLPAKDLGKLALEWGRQVPFAATVRTV